MENNFENMSLVKHCQIGNCAINVYWNETDGTYVCSDSLVIDDNNVGKSIGEIIANDNNLYEDFVDSDYDNVIMEMQLRILDNLNRYFDDEEEVIVS